MITAHIRMSRSKFDMSAVEMLHVLFAGHEERRGPVVQVLIRRGPVSVPGVLDEEARVFHLVANVVLLEAEEFAVCEKLVVQRL